ncbi:esterase family protein [Dyadobacter psychrotolerans]|uniref:Esterase family protein n=1 Tax=Dyadobacter psychrotolerans TaxID=2541721 RepID=A0A4V2Z491_9BACT|nr:esterase family protein [Dyadobacter psychrotolerans]
MQQTIYSDFLHREVIITVLLPLEYNQTNTYRLMLCNDGQDFEAMGMAKILKQLWEEKSIEPSVVVGIHAGEHRLYEYGTCLQPDYANRGNRASETRDFVLNELLPFLENNYNIYNKEVVYAGFSLGGLMALDIVFNHADIFSTAAVFSGALWWRQKALNEGYHDVDRIMHAQIRSSKNKQNLKFWFQCGGLDETDDRDGDGIIDSIQDTLECIAELERKGYSWNKDIKYLEMPYGEHNINTWSLAMPLFLTWAFGKTKADMEVFPAIW